MTETTSDPAANPSNIPEPADDRDFGKLHPALAGFPDRWRETVLPKMLELEKRRKKAVRSMRRAMFIAGPFVLAWAIWRGMDGLDLVEILVGAVVLAVAAGIGWAPHSGLARDTKKALLLPAIDAAGLGYTESGFEADHMAEMQASGLMPDYDRITVADRVEGENAGRKFVLYKVALEEERTVKGEKEMTGVFRGVVGAAEFPSSALGTTLLARDAGILEALVEAKQDRMTRAGLVDQRFEDIFTAWTTDQVEARYFLTPTVMQALLDLESKFMGAGLRCAFTPGLVVFALRPGAGGWLNAPSMYKPLDNPESTQRLMKELSAVLYLMDTLTVSAPKGPVGQPAVDT